MLAFLRTVFLLAWSLVRVSAARLVGKQRGLAEFFASYRGDDLLPLSIDDRKFLDSARGCIACGLCALGAPVHEGRVHATTPMNLFLASSRSLPDYRVALESFDAVDEESLAELEADCPAGVHMRELVRFVRKKGRELPKRNT